MFDGTLVKLIKFPAEHLTIFHGTLVFRGTPVENHCCCVSSHVVKALQGLPVWKQCFQKQFGMDFLAEEVFPKCVYVRIVDNRITVFAMYAFFVFFLL